MANHFPKVKIAFAQNGAGIPKKFVKMGDWIRKADAGIFPSRLVFESKIRISYIKPVIIITVPQLPG